MSVPRLHAAHRRLLTATALVVALAAFPLGALASHQFGDVPDSNIYHADIDALADSGVTTGCGGGNFCPSAFVTREQMAAFMNRLGALAPGKTPVVNAATAEDSDTLDGLDSTDFMPSGDIVVNNDGTWVAASVNSLTAFGQSGTQVQSTAAGTMYYFLPLVAPLQVGPQVYGLSSVEICHGTLTASDPVIVNTAVRDAGTGIVTTLIDDGTDIGLESNAGCYAVSDLTPQAATGGVHLELQVQFIGAGYAIISSVRSTWAPL